MRPKRVPQTALEDKGKGRVLEGRKGQILIQLMRDDTKKKEGKTFHRRGEGRDEERERRSCAL